MRCPICHRSRSKSTHRPFDKVSLAMHIRDMHPPEPDISPELQELSDEYADLSDGAFFALAHELGLI